MNSSSKLIKAILSPNVRHPKVCGTYGTLMTILKAGLAIFCISLFTVDRFGQFRESVRRTLRTQTHTAVVSRYS